MHTERGGVERRLAGGEKQRENATGGYISSTLTPSRLRLHSSPNPWYKQIRFPPQDLDTIVSILADALAVPEGKAADNIGGDDGDDENTDDNNCPPPPGVSAAFAREFNAVTRQTLAAKSTGGGGGGGGGDAGRCRVVGGAPQLGSPSPSALADLKELAASGRSVGWFLKLASTAVGLLQDEERGLTRRAVVRAGKMLAADTHTQALQSLSVTQVCACVWSGGGASGLELFRREVGGVALLVERTSISCRVGCGNAACCRRRRCDKRLARGRAG